MSEGTSRDSSRLEDVEPRPSDLILDLESEDEEETSSDFTSSDDEFDGDDQLTPSQDDVTLSESITDEIRRGVYTCLICTGEVDQDSKVWSCGLCYRVYDLSCIKSWAVKSHATELDRLWRCPACNGKHQKIPKEYTCWCGKVVNPSTNILNPHSCSSTCNYQLSTCSHGCSLSCHPGPHTKRCGAVGPRMSCHCGDKEQQVPCIMTPYKTGWNCGKVCGDLMPCGEHRCSKTCHKGLCGPCSEPVMVQCYCGKHETQILCHERVPKKSVLEDGKTWIGMYLCEDTCAFPFSCGNHFCEQSCHPPTLGGHNCPLSPEAVTTCGCGKVLINDLVSGGRESCLDPIPTCDNICGKKLPCGHECIWKCHEGECSPCFRQFSVKCSCQYSQFTVPCKFIESGGVPKCKHKCQLLLNCRRHRCNNVCCSSEQIAMARERERKKQVRRLQLSGREDESMNIEAVHICTKDCGKLLSCGLHYCNNTCHVGRCPPCMESTSDDLVCSCGQTVVPAPVRCGTKLPPCPHPCLRVPSCGHPLIPHNCHEDDVECPKCTKLVVKECQCHRKISVKNVMCFQKIVSCGNQCGLRLPCGHKCTKSCHKPGECLKKCTAQCGAIKTCGHLDTAPCHYPRDCNEKFPCPAIIILKCDCGRITKDVSCGATLQQPSDSNKKLECNEECARAERNRQLFEALNINSNKSVPRELLLTSSVIDKLLEVENPYPSKVLSVFHRQQKWCLGIEKIFKELMMNKDPLKSTYHFPAMIKQQREFVHELAQCYKLFSQSHDQEPRRSVMIQKLQSSKSPTMSLSEGYKFHTTLKEREQWKRDKELNGIKEVTDSNTSDVFFNAIIIQDVFFGITRDDIEKSVSDILDGIKVTSAITKPITISFVDSKSFVLYGANHTLTSLKLENDLYLLMKKILVRLREKSILFDCELCKLDETGSIVYEIENGAKKQEPKLSETSTEEIVEKLEADEVVEPEVKPVTDQQWW